MLPPDPDMAVNGPQDLKAVVDVRACAAEQLPPLRLDDSPARLSLCTGPTSPGKKRVRISDSTSVMLIHDVTETRHRRHLSDDVDGFGGVIGAPLGDQESPRVRKELNFRVGEKNADLRGDHELELTGKQSLPLGSAQAGDGCGEYTDDPGRAEEYTICTLDKLTFPEALQPTLISSLHSSSTGSPASLSPHPDSCNRVLVLPDPQSGGLTSPLDPPSNAVFTRDRVTGWPLKRSPSLESRDNPFLPGGDLSKETEELLKRATIVRDKFYLENEKARQQQLQAREDHAAVKEQTTVDGAVPLTSALVSSSPQLGEERIAPPTTVRAQAASPPSHPRENGKASGPDGVAGPETSPDGVRLDVGGAPTADGSRGPGSTDISAEQQEKDKAKRRPKCCVVM